MPTQTYALGCEVQHKGKTWLVVRIDLAQTLVQEGDTSICIVEDFVQLVDGTGEHDFITLNRSESPFPVTSQIKALPSMPWRMR